MKQAPFGTPVVPGGAGSEACGRVPDHVAELGQPRAQPFHRGAEVGLVPALDGEQEGCARAAEDVPDLRPPVAHVDAGRDRAEARGAEVGDQVEGRGRQEERHHVAAADAACGEGRGGPVGERVPVAVGEALAPVAEGLGVGRILRGRAEEVAEHASHCRIHGTGPRACKGLPPGAEPWQDGA